MDLKQLRSFIAIVEHASFNGAATFLNVSQPSLSVRIKNLEHELGEELLVRGARGVALTSVGEAFFSYAKSIVREANKAIEEVQIMRGLRRGRVQIGLSSIFTSFVTPDALGRFSSSNPHVSVEIDVSAHTFMAAADMVEQGRWDFALVFALPRKAIRDGVKLTSVTCFSSSVYAGASHPLASRNFVTAGEMAEFNWLVGWSLLTGDYLKGAFATHNVSAPRIAMTVNSSSLIRELVQQSTLLCILPDKYVWRETKAGDLVLLRQDVIRIEGNAVLITPTRLRMTPAARTLADHFIGAATGLSSK